MKIKFIKITIPYELGEDYEEDEFIDVQIERKLEENKISTKDVINVSWRGKNLLYVYYRKHTPNQFH